ncbi:NifB/NifX family molybdenum-iron cluster-binding protein [Gloeothece verrucosa]|uniref:Dinitrogenase iron-molybdenum cofactor biosynthesis protein n=1 Tax=Gloeothece verrucosa (strain PCC 7822) TaxID=497965 RepID=E0UFT3_GLOV7|nr:NifB/NifX family molybdenum-iron cluster-binding protein [Gloeothece verrucosa]ADN13194.1 Dinitrogenase iron-molybdenum cofactor biosynthesis protein [Gloeothece verrucosa PCC 7822]
MKFAVVSQNFETIGGKTGRARNFLIYEASQESKPVLLEKLEVPETEPTFHDLHLDDTTPHRLDQTILITGEAGEGLKERLSRRGITVYITSETDPVAAINGVLQGTLPTVAPTPHKDDGSC